MHVLLDSASKNDLKKRKKEILTFKSYELICAADEYQTGNVSFYNNLQLSSLKQSVNMKEKVMFVLCKKIIWPKY